MNNLFIPHTHEGFNTDVLKPGMFVKFSVIEKELGGALIRLENTGLISHITEDKIIIVANYNTAYLKDTTLSGSTITSERYRKVFKDYPDIFYAADKNIAFIELTIGQAKELSLQLSYLDEYGINPMTDHELYYWR